MPTEDRLGNGTNGNDISNLGKIKKYQTYLAKPVQRSIWMAKKSLLPLSRKIANVPLLACDAGTDTMTVRLFTIGFAFIFGGPLLSDADAQTPAAISYGSIAPAENSTILAASSEYFSPVYVAQNATPAPITLIPDSPVLSSATPTVGLPPFDPYSVSSPPSWFSSAFPGGAGSSPWGQTQPSNIYSGNFDRFVPETYEAMRRFRDATSFEYTHIPRAGNTDSFGMDEIDMRLQLAFPCRFIPDNGKTGFFYVAPGGSLVWWNGHVGPPDMSPSGFGAFLDFGAQPKFNDVFTLAAWGRLGLFSDFERVSSDAFRYQGRLEGIFKISPPLQLHVGVIYYGRARVKMLPTVGVVWTPDDDWMLRLVFPNPKVSRRMWRGQQADWWGYVTMDYGGSSWDIKDIGLTDYNDIRLGVGVEFATHNRIGGYFEFGGSLARELYSGGNSWATPPSVLYLKTGIIF